MSGKKLLFIILLLAPFLLKAQEDNFNFWSIVDLKKNIHNWEFTTEFELRESGFFDKMQRFSIQPELSYNVIKYLKIGGSYSYMSVYDFKYDDYQPRNRYAGFVEGRVKIKRLTVKLKEKFELTTKDESDRIKLDGEIDTYKINPEKIWRNKLRILYDVPNVPLEFGLALESFYQLNNPDGNKLEKLRYSFILNYRLDKKNEVELFSHINNKLIDSDAGKTFILGISFSHSF